MVFLSCSFARIVCLWELIASCRSFSVSRWSRSGSGRAFPETAFAEMLFPETSFSETLRSEMRFSDTLFEETPFPETVFSDTLFPDTSFPETPFPETSVLLPPEGRRSSFAEIRFSETAFPETPFPDTLFPDTAFPETAFSETDRFCSVSSAVSSSFSTAAVFSCRGAADAADPVMDKRKAASRPQPTIVRNPFPFIYFPSLCRTIS